MRISAFSILFLSLAVLLTACTSGSAPSPATPTATADFAVEVDVTAENVAQAPTAPVPSPTPPSPATPEPTQTEAPSPTATAPPAPTLPPPPPTEPAVSGVPAPIIGYGFPYQLTVPTGTTVIWTNHDSVLHDVTAKDKSWTSGVLAEGESYARTFDKPGAYVYICEIHPYMTAALIVE